MKNILTQRVLAQYSHLGYDEWFYCACKNAMKISVYTIDFHLHILLLNEVLLLLPLFKASKMKDTVQK